MGSGVGDSFGPRCNKGDVMGCGVLFPRDWECSEDSEEEGELVVRLVESQQSSGQEGEEYETDSGEEEDWWRPDVKQGDRVQVSAVKHEIDSALKYGVTLQVYFTRNGKIIGKKEVVLPKGGNNEKNNNWVMGEGSRRVEN